jgi:prepilin-type N-terminal cleavage/methylation domain-containing protein
MLSTRRRSTLTARMTTPATGDRGHTLLEMIIVIAVFAVVLFLVHGGISASVHANDQMQRTNRLNVMSHDILSRIERDLARSHRVFTESQSARDLIARLEGKGAAILENSLLPIVDSAGILERDETDNRRTGNVLMFAATIPPISTDISDEFSPERLIRIDLYRFVIYHLANHSANTEDHPRNDIRRWSSLPVASYVQVMKVKDDDDRRRLVHALIEFGVAALWDSTADDADAAFCPLVDGELPGDPDAAYEVPRDPVTSPDTGLVGNVRAGIAVRADEAPDARIFAPEGSTMTPGFEVKMVGPASARQVLINLTTIAHKPNSTPILLRRSIVVGARDM